MPIPLIVAGLSAIAGIIGIGEHMSAKEKNEKAQIVVADAQDLYNYSKYSLEKEKSNTENALLRFGYAKKKILDCSMKQFLHSYEKTKSIEVINSVGLDELSNYAINQDGAIQIRKMIDIYSSTISSGTTGAAAGAIIVLAANGSLSVVTGVLSMAGSTLAMGEVGAAASIAGSALSFGASMTPLAAIVAPAVLFTGLSASIKADENFEKAQSMYAEATAAAEKMKISETLCVAIANRSNMFNDLLLELDVMFSECASMLEAVVQKKSGFFGRKKIKAEKFTEEELKLIAVTRALAGAVKSIIDTPILSDNGTTSVDSEDIYNQVSYKLPVFSKTVKEIESYDYKVKPKELKQSKESVPSNNNIKVEMPNLIRNIFAIVLGLLVALLFTDTLLKGVLASIILSLLIIKWNENDKELNAKTDSKIHKKCSRFLKRLVIAASGICLINTILPSHADIISAPISEYVEKADIPNQANEKIDPNQRVAPIIPVTDIPTEGVLTVENGAEDIFQNTFICADSDKRYLNNDEIIQMGDDEKLLAMYEIMARHGAIFSNVDDGEKIQMYFDSQKWYAPLAPLEEIYEKNLNDYETANVVKISNIVTGKVGENEENYILPYSDSVYYTEGDLSGLSKANLRLARNEIYAKHGREFENEDLKQYFSKQSWYSSYLSAEEFDASVLNEYEKANLDLIISAENQDGFTNTYATNIDWYSRYDDVAIKAEALYNNILSQDEYTKKLTDEYTLWDRLLNEVYQYIKAQSSDDLFEKIKKEQKLWLRNRDLEAEQAKISANEGYEEDAVHMVLIEQTKNRILYLLNKYVI